MPEPKGMDLFDPMMNCSLSSILALSVQFILYFGADDITLAFTSVPTPSRAFGFLVDGPHFHVPSC
jgi:hypothetical protein